MYSLQIHKQAIVLTTRGESKCTHFRMFGHLPAYINFKKTNPPQFGDHNHTMAGTPSLAAAPGGAADATAPSAGSVPPPLGAPQSGGGRGWSVSRSEQEPGDRAGAHRAQASLTCQGVVDAPPPRRQRGLQRRPRVPIAHGRVRRARRARAADG